MVQGTETKHKLNVTIGEISAFVIQFQLTSKWTSLFQAKRQNFVIGSFKTKQCQHKQWENQLNLEEKRSVTRPPISPRTKVPHWNSLELPREKLGNECKIRWSDTHVGLQLPAEPKPAWVALTSSLLALGLTMKEDELVPHTAPVLPW